MVCGAGPLCRPGLPARFVFWEGPRAPLGSERGAPGGALRRRDPHLASSGPPPGRQSQGPTGAQATQTV